MNYSAWQVKPTNFPVNGTSADQLKYLVRFAILAPSSHNTQPWQFRLKSDHLELWLEPARRLPVSDPTDRQLFLSLGAALQNIVAAAGSYGFRATIEPVLKADYAADISITPNQKLQPSLLNALVRRHTNRLPFQAKALDPNHIAKLRQLAVKKTGLEFVTESESIDFLAKQTAVATEHLMDSVDFRRELAGWVRHNWTRSPDGMPGFVQNIPGPISLLAPLIMPRVKIGKQQAKTDAGLIKASALIIIISVETDQPADWLDAGRSFEALALQATAQGISVGALTAPVEFDDTARVIAKHFDLTGRPVAILRLGYAPRPGRHSPRRSLSQALDPER